MTHVLPAVALALTALLVVVGVTPVAPAGAAPGPAHQAGHARSGNLADRIRSVNARLDQLSKRGELLDEQYNVAAAALTAAERTAKRAERVAAQAAAQYSQAHQRLIDEVTQQYEGGGTAPSVGTLLSSSTPQAYLDSLSLADLLAQQFAATVTADQTAHARAGQTAQQAHADVATARARQATLTARRAALRRQTAKTNALLDSLTAQQRRARAHARAVAAARARAQLQAQAPAAPAPAASPAPVSGGVAGVVSYAEAQVGKPYVYGASGPNAYDCSGLTMAAWAQAGVHLPHSAAEQYNYGTHVSYSQLQPGDLIFLYHPIGHVELYVGHDLAVSAADPSMGVVYVHPSQDMADYAGATRL